MENFNKLIAMLIAIAGFSKDIHYTAFGDGFYGKHLLADRVYENLYDFIDNIKENCILGNNELPLSSAEYNISSVSYTPTLDKTSDKENFIKLADLITSTLNHIEEFADGLSCGENNLICGIADNLQGKLGLINRQVA